MTKTERVRYEVLQRVSGFGAAHGAAFPESSIAGQNFAKVAKAVAEIDAHATEKLLAVHEGRRARVAARSAVRRWMLCIARTARDIARGTPGLEKAFQMPRRDSDVTLLASARMFLEQGEPFQDEFVRRGLPATFLEDFRKEADALEDGLASRRTGRASIAAAQAGIQDALRQGMNAARTLDVVVTNTLEHDPVIYAGWRRDRRLVEGRSKARAAEATPPALAEDDAPTAGEVERGVVPVLTHPSFDKAS